MKIFYCDETNFEKRNDDFFVYGGLVFDGENASLLSKRIDELRRQMGVPKDYQLKFNPGPNGFSHSQFIQLKQAVLEAASEYDAKLIVNVLLHNIAKSSDEGRRNCINTVLYNYNKYLEHENDHGLVVIDRFDDQKIDQQLRERASVGLTDLPYAKEHKLSRILGYSYSAIGLSHFSSLADVVLGSLRFAINAHTQEKQNLLGSAHTVLQLIKPLFHHQNGGQVAELSFCYSPKSVKNSYFRAKYLSLKTFLNESEVSTAQPITNNRQYDF